MRRQSAGAGDREARWSDSPTVLLQLLALSLFSPLSLWAVNAARAPELARLFVISLFAYVLALGTVGLLRNLVGLPRAGALVTVLLFGTFSWLLLERLVAPMAQWLAVSPAWPASSMVVALALLAWRYGDRSEFRRSISMVALALVAVPLLSLARWTGRAEAAPPAGTPVAFSRDVRRPDVYLVVLDGYGRSDVLQQLYGFSNEEFTKELTRRGFNVAPRAQTNYSMTYAALTSALAMDYPIPGGHVATEEDRSSLYQVLGGSNPVVASLKQAGYRYVHVESGWGGTRCGPQVDTCIESPFLDESVWTLFERTPLLPLLERRWGHAFSQTGLHSLVELIGLAAEPSEQPRFVFTHVLLPHAPLYVNRECRINPQPSLAGLAIGSRSFPEGELLDLRRAAYTEQIECVNDRLLAFLHALGADPDAVIMLTGDHGPDSLGQISKSPEHWTELDLQERFSIFSAYRVPADCRDRVYPEITLVNSFRVVLSCISGNDVPLLPDQNYIVTLLELSEPGHATELVEVP